MARTRRMAVAVTAAAALASGAPSALAEDGQEQWRASSPAAEGVAAGPGEWDLVAQLGFFQTTSYDRTKVAHSAGGDFRACVSERGHYRLREADTNGDDYVLTDFHWLDPGTCRVYEDIGSFVDGSNNRAEFYLERWQVSGGSATYWD